MLSEGTGLVDSVALPSVHADPVVFFGADGVKFAPVVVEVVVVLATVEGEVTGLTHEFGNGLHSFGEMNADVLRNNLEFAGGTVLMGAGGGLIDSGDDGGAAGRANRGGHEGSFEEDAIGRKLVDGGGVVLVDGVVIAPHVGREILDEDPEDVGALFLPSGSREKAGKNKERKEG